MNNNRERILDDAGRLFLQYGFKRTTMEDIASKAGLSKAALYLHFKNKEDLFGSVVARQARQVLELLEKTRSEDLPADEKLSQLLMGILVSLWDFCHQAPHAPEVWSEMLPAAAEKTSAARRQAERIIAEIIAEGQAGGIFARDLDSAKIAPVVRMALAGFNVPYVEVQSRHQLLKQAPVLVSLLIRGLRCPDGSADDRKMI